MEHLDNFKNLYLKHSVSLQPLNIFGIRDESNQDKDVWNDIIGYFTDTEIKFYKGTTDPGRYWTINKLNPLGTAHLCLGYHKDIWKLEKHRKKYIALCNTWQCEPTTVWRDINKDGKFDHQNEKIYTGYFGINLHRAHKIYRTTYIGKYSAGCQVIQNPALFTNLIQQAYKSNMEKFSYFLFDYNESNIFNDIMELVE